MKRMNRLIVTMAISALACGTAAADERWLGGSARAAWWHAAKDADTQPDAAAASLWLKGNPPLAEEYLNLHLEGWLRSDDAARRGAWSGELREAYAEFSGEEYDIRIGRQIVAWGKADAVNPTDNLVTRDYTLLSPDESDQKTGAGSLKASYGGGAWRATALWLPEFRPTRFPFPKGTPSMTEEKPRNTNDQWAVKAEYMGDDAEWSLSYASIIDRNPDFAWTGAGLGLRHGRIRAAGTDGALTLGKYGLRAEAAYITGEDADGGDPFTKNGVMAAVLGGDRTFDGGLNINMQYLYRHVLNWRDSASFTAPPGAAVALPAALASNQHDETQHGATLRINQKWFNDTLEADISGAVWFAHGDSLLRPKLTYAVTDTLSVIAGAEIYAGPKKSFFGNLSDLTSAYVETRWGF